ncbi:MAG: glycogen synthase [Gemmatimonadetes bacterium]|nr:glycogen synthase [Gemmatimonadota bacterium]
MNVLFVAAEVDPWIKTGGLADVAGALPAALRSIGHDVRVVMPRYRVLREKGVPSDGPIAASFLTIGERAEEQRVWRLSASAAPTYLLDIPAAFERAAIYGESDDHRRFVLFARGVLDLMQHLREVEGWQPDVVHCHDWHAALVPNYLRTTMGYTFGHIATVFTIHNLAYQGFAPPATLSLAGLSEGGSLEDVLGGRFAGTFNFMARGIVHSDIISTVSPTYAGEIMTPEYGEGLDGVLRSRRDRMVGILNGIDAMVFDPFTDPSIAAPYRPDNMAGKGQCKAALQRETGLPVAPDRPLLGVVSRLVEQKGFDLLEAVMPWLLRETDAQLVLLGSGQANWETLFHRYAATYPDRVSARIGFDASLAQRIYAGSDMFLMPSRFEPCGLGQMIALRYGSVPIVRATGGLNDTVSEGWEGNGFRFHPYEGRYFADAIGRALAAYRNTEGWAILRERGMREDNSWGHAANVYARLYLAAVKSRGR